MDVTLEYKQDGTTYSMVLDALSIKGITAPEDWELYCFQDTFLDGTIDEQILGFHRRISIGLFPLMDSASRSFVLGFIKGSQRYVQYDGERIEVSPLEVEGLQAEESAQVYFATKYTLRLIERQLLKALPSDVSEVDPVYIKLKVEVTGTLASPETFTTNSGKLSTQESGSAYPTFDSSTYVYSVVGKDYQEATISLIGKPTVSGSNLTFQLAISDMGKPSSDGKFYTDILILRQAK